MNPSENLFITTLLSLVIFSASLRNFGTRVSEFFTRKKKDVAREAEETGENVENVVEEQIDKAADAAEQVAQNVGESQKIYVKGRFISKSFLKFALATSTCCYNFYIFS